MRTHPPEWMLLAAQLGFKQPAPKKRKSEAFKPKPVPPARILPQTGRSPRNPFTAEELAEMDKLPKPGALAGRLISG